MHIYTQHKGHTHTLDADLLDMLKLAQGVLEGRYKPIKLHLLRLYIDKGLIRQHHHQHHHDHTQLTGERDLVLSLTLSIELLAILAN